GVLDLDRALRVRRAVAHVEDERWRVRRSLDEPHDLRRPDAIAIAPHASHEKHGYGRDHQRYRKRPDLRPREGPRRRVPGRGRHAAAVGEGGEQAVRLGEMLLSARVAAVEEGVEPRVPRGVEPTDLVEPDVRILHELADGGRRDHEVEALDDRAPIVRIEADEREDAEDFTGRADS